MSYKGMKKHKPLRPVGGDAPTRTLDSEFTESDLDTLRATMVGKLRLMGETRPIYNNFSQPLLREVDALITAAKNGLGTDAPLRFRDVQAACNTQNLSRICHRAEDSLGLTLVRGGFGSELQKQMSAVINAFISDRTQGRSAAAR